MSTNYISLALKIHVTAMPMVAFVTHDPLLPLPAIAAAASMLSISLHEVCRSVVFSRNQITTKKSTFHYYLLPTDFTWC